MPIVFSDHALKKTKQRKVSRKRVIETIRNYSKKIVSFRGRVLRQKKFGDTILEVVTKTEGPRVTVITAYYL